jgi:hypothetical protein
MEVVLWEGFGYGTAIRTTSRDATNPLAEDTATLCGHLGVDTIMAAQ